MNNIETNLFGEPIIQSKVKDYSFIYEKLLKKGLLEFTLSFDFLNKEIQLYSFTSTPFEIFDNNGNSETRR